MVKISDLAATDRGEGKKKIAHNGISVTLKSLLLHLLPDDGVEGVGHDAAVARVLLLARRGVGEDGLVCYQALPSALLGGGCGVDVVEKSLEIVAGKGAVHLLARPCWPCRLGFRFGSWMIAVMTVTVVTMMMKVTMMMTMAMIIMAVVRIMMMMITYHQGDIRPKGEFGLSVGGRNWRDWRSESDNCDNFDDDENDHVDNVHHHHHGDEPLSPALPVKVWSKRLLPAPLEESFHFAAATALTNLETTIVLVS